MRMRLLALCVMWLGCTPLAPWEVWMQKIVEPAHSCTYAKTATECKKALSVCAKTVRRIDEWPEQTRPDPTLQMYTFEHWASCEAQLGQYADSEAHYRHAIELGRRLSEPAEHFAWTAEQLSEVLEKQGKFAEAEVLQQQIAEAAQKEEKPRQDEVAISLLKQAAFLNQQGNSAEAEVLHRQAIELATRAQGPEDEWVLTMRLMLSPILYDQGKKKEAEDLCREILALFLKKFGPEHPKLALVYVYLMPIVGGRGAYAEAEVLARKALAIELKESGRDGEAIPKLLINLGTLLKQQGKHDEGVKMIREGLELMQKRLGPEHPNIASSVRNLAFMLLESGDVNETFRLLMRLGRIQESHLRAVGSEARMERLLASTWKEEDAVYSLLLRAPDPTELRRLAVTTALLRRGRAAEAGRIANRVLHRNLTDPDLARSFAQWQELRQQREAMVYNGAGSLSAADYQAQLRELELSAKQLEAKLAARLPALRELQPPAFDDVLPSVARRLPADGVLVEFIWMQPFEGSSEPTKSQWGKPRYMALLLFSNQQVAVQDLGEAAQIDVGVARLHKALSSIRRDPIPPARALFDRLLRPLSKHLGGRTRIYLSLDGSLSMVPFDALHDDKDYLLGRYHFHYLTSGRDLLLTPSTRTAQAPLLLANPDFGKPDGKPSIQGPQSFYHQLAGLTPLPGAQREVEALARLLGVPAQTGGAATEALVQNSHAPRILHIATHGLFLFDVNLPTELRPPDGLGGGSEPSNMRSKNVTAPKLESRRPDLTSSMNRSALVLAGARQGHHAPSPNQDGLLTAEEARSLDLEGTQLVVLSACETGYGELSAGQGVYGLRRAFLVAGAETLVTSLWRIHDDASGELMVLYYQNLLNNQKPGYRLGAMEEAMQELRTRPGRSHPYFWAPFLVIGQDGPLRGTTK